MSDKTELQALAKKKILRERKRKDQPRENRERNIAELPEPEEEKLLGSKKPKLSISE
jgi:hypothetical protein